MRLMVLAVSLLSSVAMALPVVDCTLKAHNQSPLPVFYPLVNPKSAFVYYDKCIPQYMVLPVDADADTIAEEVAHVVARRKFGCSIDSHGPEWKALYEQTKPLALKCMRKKLR